MLPIAVMAGGDNGVVVTLSVLPGSYSRNEVGGTDAVCTVTYNADGTWAAFDDFSTTGNWYAPTTGGVGSGFWIRWTNTSGTLSTGTAGSWLALSTSKSFSVEFTPLSGSKSCTGTVELATDAGGSNVVASGSVTITAISSP